MGVMKIRFLAVLLAFFPGWLLSPLQAQVVELHPSGNTSVDTWTHLQKVRPGGLQDLSAGFGGFPGFGPWTGGVIYSDGNPEGAYIAKTADGTGGGPFIAGSSLYFGGTNFEANVDGGKISVVENTPLAGVETIIFQIEISGAYSHVFHNHQPPVLSITTDNGQYEIAGSTFVSIVNSRSGYDPINAEDTTVNTYAFQWNLAGYTGLEGNVISFSIIVNAVQHAQIYSMQLLQTDETQPYAVVPEASAACLFALAAWMVRFRVRRKGAG